MARFATITEIKAAPGLRMACLRGVPSPWTEAAKGIFFIKGLDCQYGAQGEGDEDGAVAAWAGDSSVPVVAFENEPLRTGWADILILAERLAPAPALIPGSAAERADCFGLAHEICGQMGLGWAYRLIMAQRALSHEETEGKFPPGVGQYLGAKYGLNPVHAGQAKARVLSVLGLLDERLAAGPWLCGQALSAVDVYWAVFANLFAPLPEDELPALPMIREAYSCRDEDINAALTPRLRPISGASTTTTWNCQCPWARFHRLLRGYSAMQSTLSASFDNRVTRMLGVEIPIVQAPMGWIARSALASAVSNAGALGIIETSSGELDAVRGEILKMRQLTDKPFGVNIAQAFVRDPNIVQFVIDQGVQFVTTSAGNPERYTEELKNAGLTVFHVVPSLGAAKKAVDCGVDGLVVEGGEGGGFKNPREVASMVLLPLVRSQVDVPIIAAGGFVDGRSMAAAFALGAEGVQMGTRMVSAAESPVHENWKNAVVQAKETDTVFLNRHASPALRALRTEKTSRLEYDTETNAMTEFGTALDLYFGGDMEASIALSGQVCGRIDAVRPVAEIIAEVRDQFFQEIGRLAANYLP